MIPTAMLAGLLLGLAIRWWAVPVVAVAWAVAVTVGVDAHPVAALALGAANAAPGAALAVLARRRRVEPCRTTPSSAPGSIPRSS